MKKVTKKNKTKNDFKVKSVVVLDSAVEDIIDDSYGSIQEFLDKMISTNQLIQLKIKKNKEIY
jgi:hypothetical protein